MEQHIGKAVRVSGDVEGVEFGAFRTVNLKSATTLRLYFDADGYDAEPLLLALSPGDKILVSGQIYRMHEKSVSLDKCKLIEARGHVS
jgi:hypothetical protein